MMKRDDTKVDLEFAKKRLEEAEQALEEFKSNQYYSKEAVDLRKEITVGYFNEFLNNQFIPLKNEVKELKGIMSDLLKLKD